MRGVQPLRPLVQPLRPERLDRVGLVGVLQLPRLGGLQAGGDELPPPRGPVRRRRPPRLLVVQLRAGRGGPLDQQVPVAVAQVLQGEGPALQHQLRRRAVGGRHQQQLRLGAFRHRRRQALVDRRRPDLPRLVDGGHRGAVPVDGLLRPQQPPGPVRQQLDLLLPVDLPDAVVLRPGLRPDPGGPLDLLADRQVLPGVHHVLRLAEPFALVDPPEHQLPQQPALAELAGHRKDQRLPHQPPALVDLQQPDGDEPLPPPQVPAGPRLGPRDELRADRPDGAAVRRRHQPRPHRRRGDVEEALQPRDSTSTGRPGRDPRRLDLRLDACQLRAGPPQSLRDEDAAGAVAGGAARDQAAAARPAAVAVHRQRRVVVQLRRGGPATMAARRPAGRGAVPSPAGAVGRRPMRSPCRGG